MKKFVFSLQSVYNYKKTIEKRQKDDLRIAQARLAELQEERAQLDRQYESNAAALTALLERNENLVEELPKFDAYFRFLREEQKTLDKKIVIAEAEKDRIMNQLIRTMREIKTYSKLRDEQFARYREEVAREDEKEIGDIVSFKATFPEELDM